MFSLVSLLFFSILSFFSPLFLGSLSYLWYLFLTLVATDALGTLASNNTVVAADRALYFLGAVTTEIVEHPAGVFQSTIVILGLIAALDFSLLLRKLDATSVDLGILTVRLKSYALTILPAFLLTYVLLYAYSLNLGFSPADAAIVLGLTSVGVLVIIYWTVTFMLSLRGREAD